MQKAEVARALEEIAQYLELQEPSNPFRALAYRKAAGVVEELEQNLDELVASHQLGRIAGIGKATGSAIEELIATGRSSFLEELRSEFPAGILELIRVPGLGMKKIATLHEELGIASIDELEAALEQGELESVSGFGPKTREKLKESIEHLRQAGGKLLLPQAKAIADRLAERMGALDGVDEVIVTGQIRRRIEVVDRIEILVVTGSIARVAKAITALDVPEALRAEGKDRLVGTGRSDIPVEVRLVGTAAVSTTLFFSTGSEDFVEAARRRAEKKGLRLEVSGIRDESGRDQPVTTEREIFRLIGRPFVEPELREDDGWLSKRPPKILSRADLQGTFHVHSTWSDGKNTLAEMVAAAEAEGFQFVGLSDHSKTASYAGGLTEARVDQQHAEIESLTPRMQGIRMFRGTECDILPDGTMDYDARTLAKFDFVIASVHSRFRMSQEEMTERMVRALRNPFVTFLGHLTGRLLLRRKGYAIDFDRIFDVAAEEGVIIEINANPRRAELDWRLIRRAVDRGVTFSINPDAHSVAELARMESGVWVARKGGLPRDRVFNTRPVDEVAELLRERRSRALGKIDR